MDYAAAFNTGLTYADFLARHGTDDQRQRWSRMHAAISLSAAQRTLLAGFTRDMPVLCLAGAWCGDCVNQCPIFDHFAAASPRLQIRYFDRDAHSELGQELRVCGAARVPAVLFLSEDFQPVGRYGDRTLSQYRRMAASLSGAACSTGLVPEQDRIAAVTQEWLNEFERCQLILRTSARLREKHGD